ncbi:MAG TPA: hypothetical protein VHE53_04515 [Patescibacteria group bacterium]|nr:hypothetical protein [Patescibacteria group bacterium]
MRDSLRLTFKDKLIRLIFYSCLVLIIVQIIVIGLFYAKLPPLVPFLNSQRWGVDRLYPAWATLLIVPGIIIVFIVNNLLSAIFYKKNTLIARILSFNSLLFVTLSFLAFLQIIFLVF